MGCVCIQTHSWMIDSATGTSMEIDLRDYKTPVGSKAEEHPLGE